MPGDAGYSPKPAQMGGSSFVRRKLRVTIGIGRGKNGEEGQDLYTLPDGLRIRAHVEKVGGYSLSYAAVQIFGLTLDLMNKLSSLGLSHQRHRNNSLRIEAGDDVRGMTTVFQGTIDEGAQDFSNPPDTALNLSAYAGLREQLLPIPPTSSPGAVDAVTIMADLAGKMGLGFENAGVQGVQLNNPYFPGTAREQVILCAEAGGFEQIIELGLLLIWPKGGSRDGLLTVVNKDTGLVGYPSVGIKNSIVLRTLFNPAIAFLSPIKVESVIGPANGTWYVQTLSHDLESETPGGGWFSDISGLPYQFVVKHRATPA